MRRKYFEGKCQDCGWIKRVTRVIFWATGMPYTVCAECIKSYRRVILKPCEEDSHVIRPRLLNPPVLPVAPMQPDILIADFPNGRHAYLDTREYTDVVIGDIIAYLLGMGAVGFHVGERGEAEAREAAWMD